MITPKKELTPFWLSIVKICANTQYSRLHLVRPIRIQSVRIIWSAELTVVVNIVTGVCLIRQRLFVRINCNAELSGWWIKRSRLYWFNKVIYNRSAYGKYRQHNTWRWFYLSLTRTYFFNRIGSGTLVLLGGLHSLSAALKVEGHFTWGSMHSTHITEQFFTIYTRAISQNVNLYLWSFFVSKIHLNVFKLLRNAQLEHWHYTTK